MPNVIAKQETFTLLQNAIKPHIIRNRFTVGDSVILNIQVMEDINKPKDLSECKIDIKALRENENSLVEQRFEDNCEDFKIEILIPLEGRFKAKLKPNFVSKSDRYKMFITIKDNDENITIQQISYVVEPSIDTDIVEVVEKDISTIKNVHDLLTQYENELVNISSDVDKIISEVKLGLTNIENEIVNMEDDIENRIVEINKAINGVENSLKINTIKQHKLTPVILEGNNFVYLKSDLISLSNPRDLAKCVYSLQVNGKVANDLVVHNSISDLLFTVNLDSSNKEIIQANTYSRIDLDIQGRKIEPSVVFDNMSINIKPDKTTFYFIVKTKINKNYINSVNGYLTPLGIDIL